MSLGLMRKHALCKICCSFEDKILGEITADILLSRRSYREIREHYSPLLPAGVRPLNDVNINNHRKHSDPALLAKEILSNSGELVSEIDMISQLYNEVFQKEMDKRKILTEVYRQRLNNLKVLQMILDEKKAELEALREARDLLSIGNKKTLQRDIRGITREIDEIQSSIQQVVLKELGADKGAGNNNIYFIQNYLGVIQGHLKGFLEEVVPYLLLEVFVDDTETGKAVVKRITQIMDKHVTPVLDETKLLNAS